MTSISNMQSPMGAQYGVQDGGAMERIGGEWRTVNSIWHADPEKPQWTDAQSTLVFPMPVRPKRAKPLGAQEQGRPYGTRSGSPAGPSQRKKVAPLPAVASLSSVPVLPSPEYAPGPGTYDPTTTQTARGALGSYPQGDAPGHTWGFHKAGNLQTRTWRADSGAFDPCRHNTHNDVPVGFKTAPPISPGPIYHIRSEPWMTDSNATYTMGARQTVPKADRTTSQRLFLHQGSKGHAGGVGRDQLMDMPTPTTYSPEVNRKGMRSLNAGVAMGSSSHGMLLHGHSRYIGKQHEHENTTYFSPGPAMYELQKKLYGGNRASNKAIDFSSQSMPYTFRKKLTMEIEAIEKNARDFPGPAQYSPRTFRSGRDVDMSKGAGVRMSMSKQRPDPEVFRNRDAPFVTSGHQQELVTTFSPGPVYNPNIYDIAHTAKKGIKANGTSSFGASGRFIEAHVSGMQNGPGGKQWQRQPLAPHTARGRIEGGGGAGGRTHDIGGIEADELVGQSVGADGNA